MGEAAQRAPKPEAVPCPGGCGRLIEYRWIDGGRLLRGGWVRPNPADRCRGCDDAEEAARDFAAKARSTTSTTTVTEAPTPSVVERARELELDVARRLEATGVPARIACYRWKRFVELRDERDQVTAEAFAEFQASLPAETLGITPWNRSLARELCAMCVASSSMRTVLIVGPVGTGKSTLLGATVRGLVEAGRGVVYVTESQLWEQVRQGFRKKRATVASIVQRYAEAPVLAIDDLGTTSNLKDWHVDAMEHLVSVRYDQRRPMLITTNLNLDGIADAYDERLASRLAEMTGRRQIALSGPDWRTGRLRADSPAETVHHVKRSQICDGCRKTPCKCPCPECGFNPCHNLGGCR